MEHRAESIDGKLRCLACEAENEERRAVAEQAEDSALANQGLEDWAVMLDADDAAETD